MSKHKNNNPKPGADETYYSLLPGAETVMELPAEGDDSSSSGGFSKAHCDAMILALSRGQGSFTENQVVQLEEWADQVMCNHALLQLIFKGLLMAQFHSDGEIGFAPVLPSEPATVSAGAPSQN